MKVSMLYFWVVLVCLGDTPGVRLCFRNIFSVGDIVTDAHLTMYSVLFPSLFSHTYYSSLSLLRMHKLHSPILYLSLLLLRMHNFLFFLPESPLPYCYGQLHFSILPSAASPPHCYRCTNYTSLSPYYEYL